MRRCALRFFVSGWVLACAALACSGESGSSDGSGEDAGVVFVGPGEGGFGYGGTARFLEAGCVAQVSRAEAIPFDLYILFDQSGSMVNPAGAGTRLDAVRAAAADFLRAKESEGIGVGLGYFGNFPLGSTSCDPADYQTPAVPVINLPAGADALLGSLNGISPTGETPTGAAIRGACNYVEGWKREHPARPLVTLLLTDGVPEAPISRANGCDPTLPDAVAAAKDCVASSGSPIYVLGVGPNLDNLHQIAAAGKTGSAHLVTGADVTGEVLAALNVIRGSALPCSFEIPAPPDGKQINFDQVNVVVTDNAGVERALLNVADAQACDAQRGGWYYTSSGTAPERIELCEASCEFTKAQSGTGAIRFALGCGTLSEIR